MAAADDFGCGLFGLGDLGENAEAQAAFTLNMPQILVQATQIVAIAQAGGENLVKGSAVCNARVDVHAAEQTLGMFRSAFVERLGGNAKAAQAFFVGDRGTVFADGDEVVFINVYTKFAALVFPIQASELDVGIDNLRDAWRKNGRAQLIVGIHCIDNGVTK